ncbi:MAG TPA: tryptophan synthase subunit alpha [Magnetospirillaceae bacterium]|nr:tryptophan synthase subunit alpha [Magnetospirillaceae bacterium]
MRPLTLMAHLVAGYPDASGCRAVARGLVEGGASYLEVQIPFSDPSADGPAIRDACVASLAGGFSTADSLAFLEELRREFPGVPVFVMVYASLAVVPGPIAFAAAMARRSARGIIVPDLPFDCDEGLFNACAAAGLASVPVAAPSMRKERLERMAGLGRPYLYAALRTGTTGRATEIGKETRDFLAACASGGSKVFGGFGVRSGAQARLLAGSVHAVAAGSVFVDAVSVVLAAFSSGSGGVQAGSSKDRDEAIRLSVRQKTLELTRGD